jgi:transcriptional regulator with XRE-family HTH domain
MARDDEGRAETDLSRSLLDLRRAAGLRQMDVAAATGLSQAQLSRIERGQSLPTEDETDKLSRLYRADSHRRVELIRMARDARAGIRDARLVVQRGQTLAMQQRWRRIEGEARVVRSYQPALVLGVLQTAEYASVVLEQPADSAVVRDRVARHRRLLDEPDRQHVLIQTEGALRLRVGSEDVMRGQLHSLLDAGSRPNVRLGVIPERRAVDVVAGTAFHLYDDTAVVVGLEVAAATLTDRTDIQHFRTLFDRLSAVAVWGDEARAVLAEVAARYGSEQRR